MLPQGGIGTSHIEITEPLLVLGELALSLSGHCSRIADPTAHRRDGSTLEKDGLTHSTRAWESWSWWHRTADLQPWADQISYHPESYLGLWVHPSLNLLHLWPAAVWYHNSWISLTMGNIRMLESSISDGQGLMVCHKPEILIIPILIEMTFASKDEWRKCTSWHVIVPNAS